MQIMIFKYIYTYNIIWHFTRPIKVRLIWKFHIFEEYSVSIIRTLWADNKMNGCIVRRQHNTVVIYLHTSWRCKKAECFTSRHKVGFARNPHSYWLICFSYFHWTSIRILHCHRYHFALYITCRITICKRIRTFKDLQLNFKNTSKPSQLCRKT